MTSSGMYTPCTWYHIGIGSGPRQVSWSFAIKWVVALFFYCREDTLLETPHLMAYPVQVRALAWYKAQRRQRLDVVSATSSHGHIACLLIAQCFLVFLRPSGVFTASVEKACIRMCIFHICLCKHHVYASSVARPVLITNIFWHCEKTRIYLHTLQF